MDRRRRAYRLAGMLLLAMGLTARASAQEVWLYQVIGPDDKTTTYSTPPKNITYPPDGSPAPVISADAPQPVTPLTAPQEARRLQAPQLVIDTVPVSLARDLVSTSI